MNGFSHSDESSPARAELSGLLLESVEEILREPMTKEDLGLAWIALGNLARRRCLARRIRARLSTSHTLERIQSMIRTHRR